MKVILLLLTILLHPLMASAQHITITDLTKMGMSESLETIERMTTPWGYKMDMVIPKEENEVSPLNLVYFGWGSVTFSKHSINISKNKPWAYISVAFNDKSFKVSWDFPNKQTFLALKSEMSKKGWHKIEEETKMGGKYHFYHNDNIQGLFSLWEGISDEHKGKYSISFVQIWK